MRKDRRLSREPWNGKENENVLVRLNKVFSPGPDFSVGLEIISSSYLFFLLGGGGWGVFEIKIVISEKNPKNGAFFILFVCFPQSRIFLNAKFDRIVKLNDSKELHFDFNFSSQVNFASSQNSFGGAKIEKSTTTKPLFRYFVWFFNSSQFC